MLNLHGTLLPLFCVKKTQNGAVKDPNQIRYVGSSFHINDEGLIGTCAHIIDDVLDDEILVAVDASSQNNDMYPVNEITKHPSFDFAIGVVKRPKYDVIPIFGEQILHMGTEVFAYSFMPDSIIDGKWHINQRVFKGYVVGSHDNNPNSSIGARSTCELSFPSLKGFSGTPIFFDKKETCIAGMLFSNKTSSIVSHEYSEVAEDGKVFSEKISRVIELGLSHTAFDLRNFLNDLGVDRIPLDSPNPEPLDHN